MARASVPTIIPLDRVANILGIDPLHFNSVVNDNQPEYNACDDIWFQHSWQFSGRISREDLAFALYDAEQDVAQALGYYPAPVWISDEEHVIQKWHRPETHTRYAINARSKPKSVRSSFGKIIEFGIRAKSVIEEEVTITYSDEDGDGYDETALVTVTPSTTITDRERVRAFYPLMGGDDVWEIRPINVSLGGEYILDGNGQYLLSGGSRVQTAATDVTITFRREQALGKDKLNEIDGEAGTAKAVDGSTDANFLSEIDVYEVYTDSTTMGTFVTDVVINDSSLEPYEESAYLYAKDSDRGFVGYIRSDYDEDDEEWQDASFKYSMEPDKVKLNYRAGLKNKSSERYPNLRMNPMFERAIVLYAITSIPQEVSGCDNVRTFIQKMAEDLSQKIGSDSYQLSDEDLTNPFGTTRAGIDLWNMVKRHRLSYAR